MELLGIQISSKDGEKINRKRVMETLGPSPKAIYIELFVAHLLRASLLQICMSGEKVEW
jgi:hypothetical protein